MPACSVNIVIASLGKTFACAKSELWITKKRDKAMTNVISSFFIEFTSKNKGG